MNAPSKGTGYDVEGYGRVLVKMGPSPEEPYVYFSYVEDGEKEIGELHIDEFNEKKIP